MITNISDINILFTYGVDLNTKKMKNIFTLFNIKNIDPKLIGKKIGQGVDGKVFLYDKDKIIKMSYKKSNTKYNIKHQLKTLNKIKKINNINISKLYLFGAFQSENYFCTYYICEKLNKNKKYISEPYWVNVTGKLYTEYKLNYYDIHNGNIMVCNKTRKKKISDLDGFFDYDYNQVI